MTKALISVAIITLLAVWQGAWLVLATVVVPITAFVVWRKTAPEQPEPRGGIIERAPDASVRPRWGVRR